LLSCAEADSKHSGTTRAIFAWAPIPIYRRRRRAPGRGISVAFACWTWSPTPTGELPAGEGQRVLARALTSSRANTLAAAALFHILLASVTWQCVTRVLGIPSHVVSLYAPAGTHGLHLCSSSPQLTRILSD
jgi:hypothetical protein